MTAPLSPREAAIVARDEAEAAPESLREWVARAMFDSQSDGHWTWTIWADHFLRLADAAIRVITEDARS